MADSLDRGRWLLAHVERIERMKALPFIEVMLLSGVVQERFCAPDRLADQYAVRLWAAKDLPEAEILELIAEFKQAVLDYIAGYRHG